MEDLRNLGEGAMIIYHARLASLIWRARFATIDAFWPGHVGATLNQLSIDLGSAGQPRPNEEQISCFSSHDLAWRQMKLASLPLKGEIFLDVELIDAQGRLTDGRDRSVTRLQISAEVLGDVFDVVEQIRGRTAEEHIAWEKRPKMGVVNPPNVKEIFILEDLF
ncbi:hypothetical protein MBLNU13_g07868t1 [Cladosporium sp. NU13]